MLRSEKDGFASFVRLPRQTERELAIIRKAKTSFTPMRVFSGMMTGLLSVTPEFALGATFRITPNVDISESYTDNVRSVSEGAESDLITQTEVGAVFTADGNRLNLNLNVGAVHDYYLDTDGLNGIRPNALGSGEVELLKDHFFIGSRVSLSETSTQSDGAQSARDRSLPTNRTQVLLYDVSPRLVGNMGRMLEVTLRYSHSESIFSNPASGVSAAVPVTATPLTRNPLGNQNSDQKSDDISLTLDTGKYFSRISSQLDLEKSTTKSAGRSKQTDDRVDLVNEYQLNRQLALIARVGYEDTSSGNGGAENSSLSNTGATGALGIHLKPGPRIDFRTEYGRKYGDPNLSANLIYKISSFYTLNASFEQSVTNQNATRRNQLDRLVPGPDGRLVDPFSGSSRDPAFSNFDLNNGAFQQDLFQIGLSGEFGRNTINLGADLTSRDSGLPNSKREELDIILDFSRRLQPRLTGNVALNFSDTLSSNQTATAATIAPITPITGFGSLGASDDQTRYQGDAGLSYQIGDALSSNIEYTYLLRKLGARGDISENVLSIGFQANF